jgi:hypothetical protein
MLLLPFISDASDAEAVLGRNAAAAAIADPLTATLRKSLLVLIGISSLLVWESLFELFAIASSKKTVLYCTVRQ